MGPSYKSAQIVFGPQSKYFLEKNENFDFIYRKLRENGIRVKYNPMNIPNFFWIFPPQKSFNF